MLPQQADAVLAEVADMTDIHAALAAVLSNQDPVQAPEARRAQVQAAWLVSRLSEVPETGRGLSRLQVIRPLVTMLGAGIQSCRRGMGGGLYGMASPATAEPPSMGGPFGFASNHPTTQPPHGTVAHGAGSGQGSGAVTGFGFGAAGAGSGGGASSPAPPRPLRIEPLDGNAAAAAAGALLGLARCGSDIRAEVEREIVFQEAWCGRRIRLEGLAAPATA